MEIIQLELPGFRKTLAQKAREIFGRGNALPFAATDNSPSSLPLHQPEAL